MIHLFVAAAAAQTLGPCNIAGTDMEVAQCVWSEFKKADAELNQQFVKSLKEAESADREDGHDRAKVDNRPSDAETLRQAERAWIRFRDLHCAMEGYSERGGTIERVIEASCFVRVTRERTEQLRKMW
jgi:uncharacterized protein YecT (DUF1311 family)